jgi:hypothetical protein
MTWEESGHGPVLTGNKDSTMDSLDISKLFVELMDINYPWVLATCWALG